LLPTAPPRLVEGLGIADTVGLAGHDSGSFAGIKFNPYAAMPSMHVGWSLLIGLIGFRVARRPLLKAVFVLHPILMAITVTATGNHYFLDSIVGILVALSAVALLKLPRPRLGSFRLRPAFVTASPCSSH
jgi:membrane-associated phospholipid phosphatase